MSAEARPVAIVPQLRRPQSHFARVWRDLLEDRAAVLSAIVLVVVAAFVILAPFVATHDPLATDPAKRLAPPLTGGYLLGSDELGRDIYSRLAYGGRTSLVVAIVPVIIATIIGGILGLAAGYFRRLDSPIMRVTDVLLAFPSILLAIGINAALGPGTTNLMIALVIVAVPSVARVLRSSAIQASQFDYVLAARAVGARDVRIAVVHILPNALAPVIVFASLEFGRMLILASGLSFLGLGVQPPDPDWGAMLATGRQYMSVAPHVATVPGLLIFVVALAINTLGDGIRDASDPRMRR
jgi:peptide/nickel transport system permease protein